MKRSRDGSQNQINKEPWKLIKVRNMTDICGGTSNKINK